MLALLIRRTHKAQRRCQMPRHLLRQADVPDKSEGFRPEVEGGLLVRGLRGSDQTSSASSTRPLRVRRQVLS